VATALPLKSETARLYSEELVAIEELAEDRFGRGGVDVAFFDR